MDKVEALLLGIFILLAAVFVVFLYALGDIKSALDVIAGV